MALDQFPEYAMGFDLDRPPVASITSVKYTDTAGAEQTITSTNYTLSLYGDSRRVIPKYLYQWPITRDIPDAVRIVYVTGYTALPTAAKAAILLLVGHLYENRETVNIGNITSELPFSTQALLDTIKCWAKG